MILDVCLFTCEMCVDVQCTSLFNAKGIFFKWKCSPLKMKHFLCSSPSVRCYRSYGTHTPNHPITRTPYYIRCMQFQVLFSCIKAHMQCKTSTMLISKDLIQNCTQSINLAPISPYALRHRLFERRNTHLVLSISPFGLTQEKQ